MKIIVKFIKQYWITVLAALLIIFGYKYISDNRIFGAMLFPTVDRIGKVFTEDLGVMFKNIGSSVKLVAPSLVWSVLIALGFGILMGTNEFIRNSLHPIIYALSCVPSILLSPFIILLCSTFTKASIVLIIYGVVWATLFATITGIETIDRGYYDNAKTLGIKGFRLLFKVMLPAAAPTILGGFINSLRISFVMLIYAEMYGANSGLGYYVKYNANHGKYDKMWAGLVFMILVLICVMQIFQKIKNYILRWTV